jgi:3-hydroxyacyl-[acyl-carrier-protein] dehydratase
MNEIKMNIHEILEHLPHRYPFILVDRVISMELGKDITAIKNVTVNEPFFPGPLSISPCYAWSFNCRGYGTSSGLIIF